jgi:hypothetical protein
MGDQNMACWLNAILEEKLEEIYSIRNSKIEILGESTDTVL